VSDLLRRLGQPEGAKLLIVTADDYGLCHSVNSAIHEALAMGAVTSASLLLPAPWSRHAAARYRGGDIGIELSILADYSLLRYGPITHAPSLLGGDGGFAETIDDALEHADLDEVRRECRAQLERAVLHGFDLTHICVHQGALLLRPEFFDIVLELAVEYRLPLRLLDAVGEAGLGFPARIIARQAGVVTPDLVIDTRSTGFRTVWPHVLANLKPGVTELVVHPAVDAEELRAFATDAEQRISDMYLLTKDAAFRSALRTHGVDLIGWAPLLELTQASIPR
jgi:predicted glycoside hydrolase/deacetylase ChbG (UPF0249 family)